MNNRNVDRSQAGAYGQDHGGRSAPKGRAGTVGRGQQVADRRGEKLFAPTRDRGWSPLDGRCRHPGGDSLMVVTPAWGQSFWEPFQRLSRAWPAPTPMDVSSGASPARDFVHYRTVGVSGLSSTMEWFRCIPSPAERPDWTYWHCLSSVKYSSRLSPIVPRLLLMMSWCRSWLCAGMMTGL